MIASSEHPAQRRLLYLLHFAPNGKRTFDQDLAGYAQQMHQRGWEMTFVVSAEPGESFRTALAPLGVRFVVASFPFTWRSLHGVMKQLGSVRYDLMITSFISPFCWPALTLKLMGRARRLVITDHSSGETPQRSGWKRWAVQARGRLAGRIIDAVAPVSHYNAKRDIERVYLPAEKVHVIPNGVDLARFPAAKRNERSSVKIGFAGQLIPEKGVHTLLQAVALVEQESSVPIEVEIAGKGPQREELERLAAELGLENVRFVGHIDSIPAFFQQTDIAVTPSEWAEAFGLTIVEAMASGAACVVSDAGACPEVVGEAGLVFRRGDSVSLAACLRRLVEDGALRGELGQAARERVESHFVLSDRVEKLALLCESVYKTS